MRLRYRGAAPKTWLDTYDVKINSLERKESLFDEKESELRERAAEKGRRKVPTMIRRSMQSEFSKLPYNPYDIKALLHPVDFVVFDGLERKEDIRQIVFLSKATENAQLNRMRDSVREIVERRDYDWKVARVSVDGKIEMKDS